MRQFKESISGEDGPCLTIAETSQRTSASGVARLAAFPCILVMRYIAAVPKRLERDLFGKPVRPRRPRYEWSLGRAESASVSVRAARVRWLATKLPRGRTYIMPPESFYVFEEAKCSFIYGCFVATTILSAAFIEHWLADHLVSAGYRKDARGGLAAMLRCCEENDLLNQAILNRIERLRAVRNPFVHLKAFNDPHAIGQRTLRERADPVSVMEEDAKAALITMYAVANSRLYSRKPGRSLKERLEDPPRFLD